MNIDREDTPALRRQSSWPPIVGRVSGPTRIATPLLSMSRKHPHPERILMPQNKQQLPPPGPASAKMAGTRSPCSQWQAISCTWREHILTFKDMQLGVRISSHMLSPAPRQAPGKKNDITPGLLSDRFKEQRWQLAELWVGLWSF